LRGGPQRAYGHFGAVRLAQEIDQDANPLGRADRPLEDAAQAGQRALLDDHRIAGLEIVRWQTALRFDHPQLRADQFDRRVGHDRGPAGERDDAPQAGDPLQGADAHDFQVAMDEEVRRKERLEALGGLRWQQRQEDLIAAAHQSARHTRFCVRLGI
jgi:hypothetical protein